MSYVIEQGIPVPPLRRRSGIATTMKSLALGDSFLIDDYADMMCARGCAGKFKPMRFSIRKQPGGWRVWRVA